MNCRLPIPNASQPPADHAPYNVGTVSRLNPQVCDVLRNAIILQYVRPWPKADGLAGDCRVRFRR
jgi:hypothetical protein